MKQSLVHVEIVNWEKYNPRQDRAQHSWFRVENNIVTSPSLFNMKVSQKFIWVCVLAECSRRGGDAFELDLTWLAHHLRVPLSVVTEAIQLLETRGLIKLGDIQVIESKGRQSGYHTVQTGITTNERTDERYLKFEEVYKLYPKRAAGNTGKGVGLERALKKFVSDDDFNEFKSAVIEIRRQVDSGILSPQYVPMWLTFVNSKWRNYLPDDSPNRPPHQPRLFR